MNTTLDFDKQAVILQLVLKLREHDNWCGKTVVQKAAYFVDILSGHRLGFDFVLYKHGPYSFDLADTMGVMNSLEYIKFEVAHPQYGPRIKPLDDARDILLKKYGALAEKLEREIDFVTNKLADCGIAAVERLSTALYFTRQERVEGTEAKILKIREVKPHISEAEAANAVTQVDKILEEWAAISQPKEAQAA